MFAFDNRLMLELFLIGFLSIDGEERLDPCPRLLFTVALHVPPPTSSRRHTQQVARNQDFFSFFLSHPHIQNALLPLHLQTRPSPSRPSFLPLVLLLAVDADILFCQNPSSELVLMLN